MTIVIAIREEFYKNQLSSLPAEFKKGNKRKLKTTKK
jgi:hypothetical protein